jgi:FAD-dependent urate hydroxylase
MLGPDHSQPDDGPRGAAVTKVLIVGGGVAGPVTAMALQRAGLEAVVYEAHPLSSADVGSYLTVASNGLDALAAIGAEAGVTAVAFPTPRMVLSSGRGKRLGTMAMGRSSIGATSQTLRRAHLHRALYEEATRRGVRFEFGKRLRHATDARDGVLATFEDGSTAHGDLLVGCDGVHSRTRRLIDPSAPPPRYVGLLNFGGYSAGLVVSEPGTWHMIFGKHAFFGYVADASGGTAWFANVPCAPQDLAERVALAPGLWKRELATLFAEDQGPAGNLIARGMLQLTADPTHDLPSVPRWHRARMIVIGDAAHAPSPTSGQGASMAIEDGVLLAKCLRDLAGHETAFAAFERLRRTRVERVVTQGARGSSSKAAGPIGRMLRDLMLPFVFRHVVTERSVAWMYDHHIRWDDQVA